MKFLIALIRLSYPFIAMLLLVQFVILLFDPNSDGGANLYPALGPAAPILKTITSVLAFPMLFICGVIGNLLPHPFNEIFPVTPVTTFFQAIGNFIMAIPLMDGVGSPIRDYPWADNFGGGFFWAYLLAVKMWREIEKPVERFFASLETHEFEVKRAQTSETLFQRFQRGDHIPKTKKDQPAAAVIFEQKKKPDELRDVVKTLKKEVSDLQEKTNLDPLTQLYNKSAFTSALIREVEVLRPMGGSMAVAVCDIDDFKKINDTYGHAEGDKILLAVAELLKSLRHAQGSLTACRIGGEELGLVMAGVSPTDAGRLMEVFRNNVEQLSCPHPSAPEGAIRVTVSIGLVSLRFNPANETALLAADDLARRADELLYRAKNEGKNRISVWTV